MGLSVVISETWYNGTVTYPNAGLLNPMIAGLGAALLIIAALQQARTARLRHEEQTRADLQRRFTESFSKATEQLGSDKIEVRLGGIYTLERLSRESSGDYWTVMETLCAFVRQQASWKEPVIMTQGELFRNTKGFQPESDIGAALKVMGRRDAENWKREKTKGWHLNLERTDLRGANLENANFESADFSHAHLEGASLALTNLEGAYLSPHTPDEAIICSVDAAIQLT